MDDYPIKIGVDYEENASRLEALVVRWLYGIVLAIVAYVWSVAVFVVLVFSWFHILVLGKRNETMHNFVAGYFRFYTRITAYFYLLTDERPPISGR